MKPSPPSDPTVGLEVAGLLLDPREVRFYPSSGECEDRVLDGPASGQKGSKGGP